MKSRHEKIAALLNSPVEGERVAAAAALGRLKPPKAGTIEWQQRVSEWNCEIEWAMARLGSKHLTPGEQRTIRNLHRHRGFPWSRGSDEFREVLKKLKTAEKQGNAVTSADGDGIILPQESI